MTRNAIYKRMRRRVSLDGLKCIECGSMKSLQRHHPDHNKPDEVVPLCIRCHGKISAADRSKGKATTKVCPVCSQTFTLARPRQTHCSRSCGNKAAWSRRTAR